MSELKSQSHEIYKYLSKPVGEVVGDLVKNNQDNNFFATGDLDGKLDTLVFVAVGPLAQKLAKPLLKLIEKEKE